MPSVDEWLSHTLRSINDALPKRVEKLTRLLEMEKPYVETVGGGRHYFSKEELQRINHQLPKEVAQTLYLPIVFTKHHEMDESVYLIRARGSEAEAFRILMQIPELPKTKNQHYTYKPLVAEFLNRYPTLAVIGYI
ncbi:MAG TPA: DUF61 family protein [Candidatus Caldiarchaeum subterraneum]|uniref:DUF61 family protein n=1 Tax=Caldiarchaeum subterraneum TaxID=311458 RepID=A0A832ZW38_CALS0|nr:DUF61 family protein [Aigarchaeota archaeon]HIQ29818.1 DUF61 family protein [Candidatus Caldarchaeum subterraneum]